MLKAVYFPRLKLLVQYDKTLSNFAFNFNLRLYFRVVREEHHDFNAWTKAFAFTRCGKLIGIHIAAYGVNEGIHGDDMESFRVLSKAVASAASEMNIGQSVVALIAAGKLAASGAELDHELVRALCTAATRVASHSNMNSQLLGSLLLAVGQLAQSGADVDQEAVTALSKAVIRTAPTMRCDDETMTRWAFGKLAERGKAQQILPRAHRVIDMLFEPSCLEVNGKL